MHFLRHWMYSKDGVQLDDQRHIHLGKMIVMANLFGCSNDYLLGGS